MRPTQERGTLKGLKLTAGMALAFGLLIAIAAPASAQLQQPYGANDYGGFRNILPPGQSHNATINQDRPEPDDRRDPAAVRQPAEPLRRPRLRGARPRRTPRSTSTSRTAPSASRRARPSPPTARRPGHHDRPRPDLRRPPRLRRLARERDVRRRLRRRAGPPLLHGRPAQRGPRQALGVRRRSEQGDGRRRLEQRPLHRGRPAAPVRPRRRDLRRRRRPAPAGRAGLRRRGSTSSSPRRRRTRRCSPASTPCSARRSSPGR